MENCNSQSTAATVSQQPDLFAKNLLETVSDRQLGRLMRVCVAQARSNAEAGESAKATLRAAVARTIEVLDSRQARHQEHLAMVLMAD